MISNNLHLFHASNNSKMKRIPHTILYRSSSQGILKLTEHSPNLILPGSLTIVPSKIILVNYRYRRIQSRTKNPSSHSRNTIKHAFSNSTILQNCLISRYPRRRCRSVANRYYSRRVSRRQTLPSSTRIIGPSKYVSNFRTLRMGGFGGKAGRLESCS
jgi:hypothetical protein